MGLAGEAAPGSAGPKRAAAAAAGEEGRTPKRSRVASSSTEEQLSMVVAALDGAEQLSTTGRELLRCMAGGCLRTAPERRHELQATVAQMLRQAFEGIAAGLRGKVVKASEAMRLSQVEKSAVADAFESRKADLDAQASRVNEARRAFAADNAALEAAGSRLVEAKRARDDKDGKWLGAGQLRADLERTLAEHYTPLLAGTGELRAHSDAVEAILGRVTMEDSLLQAFRAAAKLKVGDRGAFDRWAMEQMLQELKKRAVELEALSKTVPEGSAKREAATAEAEATWEQARARQRSSAAALRAAEHHEWCAEGATDVAEEAVYDSEDAITAATERRAAEERAVAAFEAGPLSAFEALEGALRPLAESGEAAPVPPIAEAGVLPGEKELLATPTKKTMDGMLGAIDSMAAVPTPMRAAS